MPAEDEMTIDERRKYLKRMRERYWATDRLERGKLLTEIEAVTGLHRKSLIRLVRGSTLERKPRRKSRGRTYGFEVEDAVRVVWESLDYVCAERLTPTLLQLGRGSRVGGPGIAALAVPTHPSEWVLGAPHVPTWATTYG